MKSEGSPLVFAVRGRSLECVRMLVAAGANINEDLLEGVERVEGGLVGEARRRGDWAMVKLLKGLGARGGGEV